MKDSFHVKWKRVAAFIPAILLRADTKRRGFFDTSLLREVTIVRLGDEMTRIKVGVLLMEWGTVK